MAYGDYVKKDACEECGWKAVHSCQLDVDHINGNHSDNRSENLRTLCSNCHRLKTWESLDRYKGRSPEWYRKTRKYRKIIVNQLKFNRYRDYLNRAELCNYEESLSSIRKVENYALLMEYIDTGAVNENIGRNIHQTSEQKELYPPFNPVEYLRVLKIAGLWDEDEGVWVTDRQIDVRGFQRLYEGYTNTSTQWGGGRCVEEFLGLVGMSMVVPASMRYPHIIMLNAERAVWLDGIVYP